MEECVAAIALITPSSILSSLGTLLCLFGIVKESPHVISLGSSGGDLSFDKITKDFEMCGVKGDLGDEMSLPEAGELALGRIGSRLKALFSEERFRQVLDFAIMWSELVLLDPRRGDRVELSPCLNPKESRNMLLLSSSRDCSSCGSWSSAAPPALLRVLTNESS